MFNSGSPKAQEAKSVQNRQIGHTLTLNDDDMAACGFLGMYRFSFGSFTSLNEANENDHTAGK